MLNNTGKISFLNLQPVGPWEVFIKQCNSYCVKKLTDQTLLVLTPKRAETLDTCSHYEERSQ